jgi:hypothetical protein
LKASANNYRLFIRSENHLLNLKLAISEYQKLMKVMSSRDEFLVLWADHSKITHWFDNSNQFISQSTREKSENNFLNLFHASQTPLILNHLNNSLDANVVVEFSFQNISDPNHRLSHIGRLTPITLDGKKSVMFSILSQKA